MKKHYAVILSLLLCFALLLGCGAAQTETPDDPVESEQTEQQTPETGESTEPVEEDEVTEETEAPEGTELPEEPTEETEDPVESEEPEESGLEVEEVPPALNHPLAVLPMGEKLELTDPMADGTYHVAFEAEDIMNVGDTFFLTAEFFGYDRYDANIVEQLQVGDTIEVCGEVIDVAEVNFVNTTEGDDILFIEINGGMEMDGITLVQFADAREYRTVTYNDYPLYYSLGEMGCVISHEITLLDQGTDPDAEPDTKDFQALPNWIEDSGEHYFSQYATTLTMEDGEVITIYHHYTP